MSMPDAIVLAFRGTQVDRFWPSVIDFAVDAHFVPVPDSHGHLVHAGFLKAFQEVWPEVEQQLRTEQARASRPLWITGHSLGAALAAIAANVCSDDATLRLHGAYTYGSPRVGHRDFCQRVTVPVYRFRNDVDLVPHLPLGLVVDHVGKLLYLDADGHLHHNAPSPLEVLLDLGPRLLSRLEGDTMKNLMQPGGANLPVPGQFADHAPINYSVLLWNQYDAAIE
jgi:triacylglycerol lipase